MNGDEKRNNRVASVVDEARYLYNRLLQSQGPPVMIYYSVPVQTTLPRRIMNELASMPGRCTTRTRIVL